MSHPDLFRCPHCGKMTRMNTMHECVDEESRPMTPADNIAEWLKLTQRLSDGAGLRVEGFWQRPGEETAALGDLRALLAERQWRPIESAPKDGTSILLYWPELRGTLGTEVIQAQWNVLAEGWMSNGWPIHLGAGVYAPINWQPPPEPPRGGE